MIQKKNEWESISKMPEKNPTSAVLIDSKIYCIPGGCYDPVSNTWDNISSLPVDDWSHFSTCAVGPFIYLFGGWEKENRNNVFCYDTSFDRWKKCTPMPTARRLAISLSLG